MYSRDRIVGLVADLSPTPNDCYSRVVRLCWFFEPFGRRLALNLHSMPALQVKIFLAGRKQSIRWRMVAVVACPQELPGVRF